MALTKEVIILLVIVGCVAVTLLGYSIHSLATNGFHGHGEPKEISDEQRRYMREFRLKQMSWMARDAKEGRTMGLGYGQGYGHGVRRSDVESQSQTQSQV